MINLMISYSVLFLWVFATLRTIIASPYCPSRDIFKPSASSPVDDFRRNVTPTELWAYPFVVSLIEQQSVTKLYRHLCGGVIVNLGVILTSCSCTGEVIKGVTLVHKRCTRLIVLAGTPDIYLKNSVHKQLRTPSRCKLHPQCDLTEKITADVALIFLKKNLTWTTHTKPMKVFATDLDKFVTKLGELTQLSTVCYQPGWVSDTIHYGVEPEIPGWIIEGRNQLIKREKCREMHCIFEDEGPACSSKFHGGFCATSYQGNPPMVADTGGPLMCHGWVFGITSIPSCDACSPTVYVGPSIWLELVKDLTKDNSPQSGAPFSRMRSSTRTFECTFSIAVYLFVRF